MKESGLAITKRSLGYSEKEWSQQGSFWDKSIRRIMWDLWSETLATNTSLFMGVWLENIRCFSWSGLFCYKRFTQAGSRVMHRDFPQGTKSKEVSLPKL